MTKAITTHNSCATVFKCRFINKFYRLNDGYRSHLRNTIIQFLKNCYVIDMQFVLVALSYVHSAWRKNQIMIADAFYEGDSCYFCYY